MSANLQFFTQKRAKFLYVVKKKAFSDREGFFCEKGLLFSFVY